MNRENDPVTVSFYGRGVSGSHEQLEPIRSLKSLETVYLSGPAVTDKAVENLYGLSRLKWLWLDQTRVSPHSFRQLQRTVPDVQIIQYN